MNAGLTWASVAAFVLAMGCSSAASRIRTGRDTASEQRAHTLMIASAVLNACGAALILENILVSS